VIDLRRVKQAQWVDAGRSCQLLFRDIDGELHVFEGFKVVDFDRISNFLADSPTAGKDAGLSKGDLILRKLKKCATGQNWGTWAINGKNIY
jgi:POB3-like N-terminal PH domain